MPASTTTTSSTTTTTTSIPTDPAVSTAPIEACHFPPNAFTNVGLGIPRSDVLAPSVGTITIGTLFVDFDDAEATRTTEDVFALLDPLVPEQFAAMSYGQLSVEFAPHFEWLRLSQPSAHYGDSITRSDTHLAWIQEAVDLADATVDFSGVDLVLVIANPDAAAVPFGPVFASTNPTYGYRADGTTFTTGITSGVDLTSWGGTWLVHELGHAMSLADLYIYGDPWPETHRFVGDWSLMGRIDGSAPEYFALERWQLGWIEDEQVICHLDGELTVEIEAVETAGGAKAIVIPTNAGGLGGSDTEAVVIESRRAIGYDERLARDGALVMVADSGIASGAGPVTVAAGTGNTYKTDVALQPGDSYSYGPVTVTVLGRTDTSDVIQVTVSR